MTIPYSILRTIATWAAERELPQNEVADLIYDVQGIANARDEDSDNPYSDIEMRVAEVYAEVLDY